MITKRELVELEEAARLIIRIIEYNRIREEDIEDRVREIRRINTPPKAPSNKK